MAFGARRLRPALDGAACGEAAASVELRVAWAPVPNAGGGTVVARSPSPDVVGKEGADRHLHGQARPLQDGGAELTGLLDPFGAAGNPCVARKLPIEAKLGAA